MLHWVPNTDGQTAAQTNCNCGILCLQVGVGLTAPEADAVQSVVEFGYNLPIDNETLPSKVSPKAHCRLVRIVDPHLKEQKCAVTVRYMTS